jgi:hypothetical protein
MTRKRGWEDSSKQPDWTDIETMMRAMGALHSADVVLTISPLGIGAGGGLFTAAICTFDVLPGSSLPNVTSSSGQWPCKDHTTLVAHMFSLLYDLDHEIGKVYRQESLWK